MIKVLLVAGLLAVLPPQRMSPKVVVVIVQQPVQPQLVMYWSPCYDPDYLWSEVWHKGNLSSNGWYIFGFTYTNYFAFPMTNVWTNVSPIYDTNGLLTGYNTNPITQDNFFSVDVHMWNVRITNYSWTEVLP